MLKYFTTKLCSPGDAQKVIELLEILKVDSSLVCNLLSGMKSDYQDSTTNDDFSQVIKELIEVFHPAASPTPTTATVDTTGTSKVPSPPVAPVAPMVSPTSTTPTVLVAPVVSPTSTTPTVLVAPVVSATMVAPVASATTAASVAPGAPRMSSLMVEDGNYCLVRTPYAPPVSPVTPVKEMSESTGYHSRWPPYAPPMSPVTPVKEMSESTVIPTTSRWPPCAPPMSPITPVLETSTVIRWPPSLPADTEYPVNIRGELKLIFPGLTLEGHEALIEVARTRVCLNAQQNEYLLLKNLPIWPSILEPIVARHAKLRDSYDNWTALIPKLQLHFGDHEDFDFVIDPPKVICTVMSSMKNVPLSKRVKYCWAIYHLFNWNDSVLENTLAKMRR